MEKASESKPKKRALTPKQERFCQEYLIDLNASQAALRAGYSPRNHVSIGAQLLMNTYVQLKISELKSAREAVTNVTAENVVREIASRASFDPSAIYGPDGKIMPMKDWPESCRRMLKSFDQVETDEGLQITKVRWYDSSKPLELLGRHLGIFRDRLEVSGDDMTLRAILGAIDGAGR